MNTININSTNGTEYKVNVNMSTEDYESKVKETYMVESINLSDKVDFSIDYGNDEVSAILDSIKNSYNDPNYMSNNTSISDCTEKYGEILKSINLSVNFDDDTKDKLTTLLDNSFDKFTDKKSKEFENDISSIFNRAFNMSGAGKKEKNRLGIDGEKVLDKDSFYKNIKEMFVGAKIFYKNNLDETKDKLNEYLESKFSESENINKLSYKDFSLLQEEITNINNNKEIPEDASFLQYGNKESILMKESLKNLKENGASRTLTDIVEKVISQNDNVKARVQAYSKIRFGYQKQLDDLFMENVQNQQKLDELKKTHEKMIEDYNKQMQELKEKMGKLNMFMFQQGKYDPIEELKKQHKEKLKNFQEQKSQLEDRIHSTLKNFKDMCENYNKFMKDPTSEIDNYVEKSENK